jgi:SAM-dependent methyltransferase
MNSSSWFAKNGLVHRIIRRHLEGAARHAHGILLDIGCGGRPYADLFRPRIARYIGLEYPGPYARQARYDIAGDALRLPCKDASVDTVLSNQVIEHVREPWTMTEEIARVLKPGGTVILTAPHIWGLHDAPDDYYRFTGYGLQYLLERAGLQVVYVHAMAGYWVTTGARFCYYLARVVRPGFLRPPLYAAVQVTARLLDRLHYVEGDTWNYIAVARKPEG